MTREALMVRIKKLMAKANDPSVTEAEAAAFAGKVQQLLLENNLAMTEVEASTQEKREEVGEQKFDFKRWSSTHRRGLLDSVCKFYMCKVLYIQALKRVMILGKPSNVEVAISMTDYLISTVVRLSNQYGRAHPGSNVIDFRRGAFQRLRERLDDERRAMERRATSSNPDNLPVLFTNESALVQAFIDNLYGKVKNARKRTIKHGRDAWAGRTAAEDISLRQQVDGGAGNTKALGGK